MKFTLVVPASNCKENGHQPKFKKKKKRKFKNKMAGEANLKSWPAWSQNSDSLVPSNPVTVA
jgi:hypothetical protein